MKPNQMSEEQIDRMRVLRKQGLQVEQIAIRLNVHPWTVQKYTRHLSPRLNAKKSTVQTYKFIHLSGKTEEVRNLNAFAKRYGLTYPLVYLVAQGKRNHHKGWCLDVIE